MPVTLYTEKDLPRDRWERLCGDSLLNTPRFLSLWKGMGGYPLYIVDEVDDTFRAGLAGIVFGKGILRRFESHPRNLPGGMLYSPDVETEDRPDIISGLLDRLSRESFLRSVITPFDGTLAYERIDTRKYESHLVDLNDDSFVYRKNLQEHLKAAERRGAKVTEVSADDDTDAVVRLYGESVRKHSTVNTISAEFLRSLHEYSLCDERLLMLKAEIEGKIIGIRISFVERDRIINWQMLLDREYLHYKPGHLIMQRTLEIAREKNLAWMDMGSGPADSESLKKYKENWGGVAREKKYYVMYNTPGKIIYRWMKR